MSDEKTLAVGVGDIKIAQSPVIISTYLGSCLAVCLYAPSYKAGGLLHLMLPRAYATPEGVTLKKEKYADTGIPEMLRQLKNIFKLEKGAFVAKIFGGANVLKNVNRRIGEENLAAVQEILKNLKIAVIASQTGGDKGYKIAFDLNTGKVICRVFGGNPIEY
jgi:chemotaxis protein CheD